jgi:transposase
MESAAKIRRLVLSGERSMRSLSRETGLSRNTISKYVNDPSPPSYHRTSPAACHKLQGFEDRLRSMWEQDQQRHRRERRTALKLYEQLVGEGYTGSYSPVCRFVKSLRSAEPSCSNAYIPLLFKAGDALQFDWSEEHVVLGGIERRIKVAHFRLCHSRKLDLSRFSSASSSRLN